MKQQFIISDKKVTVYPCCISNRPVIYLNNCIDDGENIYKLLLDFGHNDFTLVSVSNLEWNHDMSPWDIPSITKNDTPCTGGADNYLKLLTEEIVTQTEKQLHSISWRGLAGYSLGGLFAVYAVYHTDIFSRIGSMSGSLWFPDFREYVFSHEMQVKPEKIYFSLGDRECRTANSYLKSVQQNTEAIEEFYRKKGINTILKLNYGNHFKNVTERTASGIDWLLKK